MTACLSHAGLVYALPFLMANIALPPLQILANRQSVFFGGDSVSMFDYLIWPWFERLEAFQLYE